MQTRWRAPARRRRRSWAGPRRAARPDLRSPAASRRENGFATPRPTRTIRAARREASRERACRRDRGVAPGIAPGSRVCALARRRRRSRAGPRRAARRGFPSPAASRRARGFAGLAVRRAPRSREALPIPARASGFAGLAAVVAPARSCAGRACRRDRGGARGRANPAFARQRSVCDSQRGGAATLCPASGFTGLAARGRANPAFARQRSVCDLRR